MNSTDFWAMYEEYVAELADGWEFKRFLLQSDKCFQEWCEERGYE